MGQRGARSRLTISSADTLFIKDENMLTFIYSELLAQA